MPSNNIGSVVLDVHVSRAFYVVTGLTWLLVATARWLSRLLPKLVKVDVLKSYHLPAPTSHVGDDK